MAKHLTCYSITKEFNWLIPGDNVVVYYEKNKRIVFYRINNDEAPGKITARTKMVRKAKKDQITWLRDDDVLIVVPKTGDIQRNIYDYPGIGRDADIPLEPDEPCEAYDPYESDTDWLIQLKASLKDKENASAS